MSLFRRSAPESLDEDQVVLVVYGRADCHLCDVAKADIAALRADIDFRVEERDVDDSPAWAEAYGNEVPVGFIGDRKVFKYRVDSAALRKALLSGR